MSTDIDSDFINFHQSWNETSNKNSMSAGTLALRQQVSTTTVSKKKP